MKNEKPAKYLICKRIPVEVKLEKLSEEELWEKHEVKAKEFKSIHGKIA
ncbi:MAG TPA: pyruvate formate lyase activating enzyme, partial [Candidatus Atribacteria bacterium]|nr:pyruvate formate lyase activating enzyme [Candidatus Atribacteria bacterium]